MALLNAIGDAIKPRSSANLPDPILRFPRRGRWVHNRSGVINTKTAAQLFSTPGIQLPGLMQIHIGKGGQLRAPLTNEAAVGSWSALFDRVVDADRVDRRAARLHLALTPMNTRLVINKLTRQV